MVSFGSLYDIERCSACDITSCNASLRFHIEAGATFLDFIGLLVQDLPVGDQVELISNLTEDFTANERVLAGFRDNQGCLFNDEQLGELFKGAQYIIQMVEEQ